MTCSNADNTHPILGVIEMKFTDSNSALGSRRQQTGGVLRPLTELPFCDVPPLEPPRSVGGMGLHWFRQQVSGFR